MRALLVIRDDAQRNLGGDTIQLQKTQAALQALGVQAEVRAVSDIADLAGFDLAHVFNIQTAEASWAAMRTLQARGLPVVLSSIYWDMLDHWFEFAVEQKALWRGLARALGKGAARRLYVAWQRRKAPATPVWQAQRRLLEQAVRVLPNSQSEADLLRVTFNLDGAFQQKVDVVPNGIDPALYDPAPAPSARFLAQHGRRDFVLEVGAISPVKNQLGLIRALWDVPVPLVFIGKPAEALPEYAAECRALGAQRGDVLFLERMPHDELPGVYALAKVHALPSWRETPGLVSLEAACAGCQIVTTTIGSTRDYFGEHAWYVYPDDLAGLRQAVQAALAAPPRPALRARILNEFTWARAGEATLRAYQHALA